MAPPEADPYEPEVRVTITIAAAGAPGAEPSSAWIYELNVPVSDREKLADEVRGIVRDQGNVPHTFRYSGGETSWGGLGEPFFHVFLYVGQHVIDATFGAAVGALFTSVAQRFGRTALN